MAVRILTADEMKQFYGSFYERGAGRHLDRRKVAERFWCLLPYAEFWGIGDDKDRENLVVEAPDEVRRNLAAVFKMFERDLNEWLGGPESYEPTISEEYAALTELFMVAEYAAIKERKRQQSGQ